MNGRQMENLPRIILYSTTERKSVMCALIIGRLCAYVIRSHDNEMCGNAVEMTGGRQVIAQSKCSDAELIAEDL